MSINNIPRHVAETLTPRQRAQIEDQERRSAAQLAEIEAAAGVTPQRHRKHSHDFFDGVTIESSPRPRTVQAFERAASGSRRLEPDPQTSEEPEQTEAETAQSPWLFDSLPTDDELSALRALAPGRVAQQERENARRRTAGPTADAIRAEAERADRALGLHIPRQEQSK
jgi:hypothetical protein